MSGSRFDYNFGAKNNWRRWAWNRISELVGAKKKDAIVVYLPSRMDKDRSVALSKGFRAENLIGVERDRTALEEARASGALVAYGDFFDAAIAIARSRKIDVVFADLCCPITPKLIGRLMDLMLHPNIKDAVFVLNLLRGREFGPSASIVKAMQFRCEDTDSLIGSEKHRGFIALSLACAALIARFPSISVADHGVFICSSYLSTSGQVFDSIVFHGFVGIDYENKQEEVLGWFSEYLSEGGRQSATAKSVAAILAHRTMRLAYS